ncbi:threonine/serine exporter family protein [Sphingomonas sp. CROZ-RG-20F-R02-07]|uniref:threonine/serine ThrE exporter family protein n=1 Tax=Sphingomonas sp. CROZ-RG-20F-R02-07 TaxID=2914832 RepID=UPI001F59B13E|nr:threonine/serine exporter family protein [Sphingomonas sp. CROZ-RG-20F-R02-07]
MKTSDPDALVGDPPTQEETAHLAARFGRLLLANGADASYAGASVRALAEGLGHEVSQLYTAEGVLVSAQSGAQAHVRLSHSIAGTRVDMGRLIALRGLVAPVPSDPARLDPAMDAIENGAEGHSPVLIAFGLAVTAGALARLFAGSWSTVLVAGLVGAASAMVRRQLAQRHVGAIPAAFLLACITGLIAVILARFVPGSSSALCLTVAGMLLVPGVPLINGVSELVVGHTGIGLSRVASGTIALLAIGCGVLLVSSLGGTPLRPDQAPGVLPIGQDLFYSAVAAAGYAMLFEVPFRAVPICVLCGMAGHGLRTELIINGMPLAVCSLAGAILAGLVARAGAAFHGVPAVTFAFPGVVAMMPGSYGFRAAAGGLQVMDAAAATPPALLALTLSLAITTVAVTLSIGIGLLIATTTPLIPLRFHKDDAHGR